jgi:hypothetical protein
MDAKGLYETGATEIKNTEGNGKLKRISDDFSTGNTFYFDDNIRRED